jgi:5-methyltetrahydrofolate--homocysteine methyltransferase
MSSVLTKMSKAVIEGNLDDIVGLTQAALDEGLSPQEVLEQGLMAGMEVVGARFRDGDMFVPEVLLSAKTMSTSLTVLKPMLAASGAKMRGKVVLGTVEGDLHTIGKSLVGMMMEGAGFEVFDAGVDVRPETFIAAIKEKKPDIVGMSALLTTTMLAMKRTIDAIREAGLRDQVKIMVGGAPLSAEYAKQIGADGYASNAATAAEMAKSFVG